MPMIHKKLVVVGDGDCGKTCLLHVLCQKMFPVSYIPRVYSYPGLYMPIKIDQQQYTQKNPFMWLGLSDTVGQEGNYHEGLKTLMYADTDIIILCFSIDNPDSLRNVQERWAPEMRHFCPNIPIILVANKCDLRDDDFTKNELLNSKQEPVRTIDGQTMADKIQAVSYLECSSKKSEGVREIFELAATVALQRHKNKSGSRRCCII